MQKLKDWVKEYTYTTGTTTALQLAGAVSGFATFVSQCANNDTVYYVLKNGANLELGIGTFNTGTPNTLSRTTVLKTLVGSTYDDTSPAKITLAGTTEVMISPFSKTFEDIFAEPNEIGSVTPGIGSFTGHYADYSYIDWVYIGFNSTTSVVANTSLAAKLQIAASTYTDNSTAASGTAAHCPTVSIDKTTFAAANSSVTYTKASSFYVDGAPIAGTNVTISNPYAVYINDGASYFGGDVQLNKTITAGGTTGAQTINKNAGSVNFAASATSLVVTNNKVTANSVIIATVATNDSTMKSVSAVAASGSFTLYANAAATAETRVNFLVIN